MMRRSVRLPRASYEPGNNVAALAFRLPVPQPSRGPDRKGASRAGKYPTCVVFDGRSRTGASPCLRPAFGTILGAQAWIW